MGFTYYAYPVVGVVPPPISVGILIMEFVARTTFVHYVGFSAYRANQPPVTVLE